MKSIFKKKSKRDVPAYQCPHCENLVENEKYYVVFHVEKTGCSDCLFKGIEWAIKKSQNQRGKVNKK